MGKERGDQAGGEDIGIRRKKIPGTDKINQRTGGEKGREGKVRTEQASGRTKKAFSGAEKVTTMKKKKK